MALNKNGARESRRTEKPPLRKLAAIVGCDPDEVESIALLLDLLGWKAVVYGTLDQLCSSHIRIVFIDSDANDPAEIAESVKRLGQSLLVLVLVGSSDHSSSIAAILDVDLQSLARPVDLELVEHTIERAS